MSNIEQVKSNVAKTEIKSIGDFLKGYKSQLVKILKNDDKKFMKFEQIIMSNAKTMPQVSLSSVMTAILKSLQYDLEPNIHCHFVPFGKDAQFIIDYKGYIELINRSGKATILGGDVVKSNDYFEYENGLNPVLKHKPAKSNRGDFIGAYIVAKNLLANEKTFLFMNKDEIDKVKASSKASHSDYSPWNKWYDQMALKTVAKRIAKLLPLSVDVQSALSTDETITHEVKDDMSQAIDVTPWEDDKKEDQKVEGGE